MIALVLLNPSKMQARWFGAGWDVQSESKTVSGIVGVWRACVRSGISLWAPEMSRGKSVGVSVGHRIVGMDAHEEVPHPVLTSVVSPLRGCISQQPSPGTQLQPAGHQQQDLCPPSKPIPRASPTGARLPPLGGMEGTGGGLIGLAGSGRDTGSGTGSL